MIFDDTRCLLGEGPLWHPNTGAFYWFDILSMRLYEATSNAVRQWQFDEHVSAAGWVSDTELLMASASSLSLFDIATAKAEPVVALEAENMVTRSNDGRADPWGGFWIGTMGKSLEPDQGAIYRYYRGELRLLYPNITVSNAICFSPEGGYAYFTDTPTQQIMRVALAEKDGWPTQEPEVFIDMRAANLRPDGAVVDAHGRLWNAQYGAGRVSAYDASGRFLEDVRFPAQNTTCPAFGGPDLDQLFCTSAANGAPKDGPQGATFKAELGVMGQAEHQVML
ncbi:MAG: SMP-30/gluconolactonase/LRE family protein [Pseudomonadota bacterium]